MFKIKNKVFGQLFFICAFFLFSSICRSEPTVFHFNNSEPQWTFYGEGLGAYVDNLGHGPDKKSLWMSTDYGESETVYFSWKNLNSGTYKITAFVRGEDINKGEYGYSLWNFYDGGYGVQSPFMDLYGSYNWRKIEYNVKVKAHDLTIWFRLKSQGSVWIDDFSIEKTNSNSNSNSNDEVVLIEKYIPLVYQKPLTNQIAKASVFKKLYTFDTNESGHPFSVKNKKGEFKPHQFYNFNIEKLPVQNWSSYDHLEMDVINPNNSYASFFVTLADDKSNDYWSQTNYKQTLAPGLNHLTFSLKQMLGELGSHRYLRSINLAKLKKFFLIIDPDNHQDFPPNNFLIDNISLSSHAESIVPNGVMAFDFTSVKAHPSQMLKVTTQTQYNDDRGYGFEAARFSKVEDSVFASESLRYTIGLNDGHFKIMLPNGKYQLSLIINKLGYWDVPFWTDRMILANGNPLFKETRTSGMDFLSDVLQFEQVVPTLNDHPFDLYLSKIFRPVEKIVEVTNGILDLEFHGDNGGICLNTLLLWNKKNDLIGLGYKKLFNARNKLEFDWMARPIKDADQLDKANTFSASIIEPDLKLSYSSNRKAISSMLSFQGGVGENPYQLFQLTPGANDEKLSWSLTDLKNSHGDILNSSHFSISELIYQYSSPDLNHETYLITGKYLKKINDNSVILHKHQNKYLWLQLGINNKFAKGIYKGEFIFHRGNELLKFPIEVTILPYSLPMIDFPVGFFGIDPIPFTYFPSSEYNSLRKKYRHIELNLLGNAGFTTFTGLPENIEDLNELFNESSKFGIQTVFSYGGQFPNNRLDISRKPPTLTDNDFFQKSSNELKSIMANKKWPKIVYTFSDEAAGYSDKISSDLLLAQKLKKYYPFLPLGGFGSFINSEARKLNKTFDYGFYSSLTKSDISDLKDNNKYWGYYNGSSGNFDDPRFSFGLGLYIARLNGMNHYLEWHSSAFLNYPYYDFDGREADNVMFYPSLDGHLYNALRFELAVEGLHSYRKLKLLDQLIAHSEGNSKAIISAQSWLTGLRKENTFYSSKTFMAKRDFNFSEFKKSLDFHLKQLFLFNP